jgi:hypothetical protein
MTSRFKDFGAPTGVEAEPLSFKLYGEEFNCRPNLQGATLLKLVKGSGSENASESANTILSFFDKVLDDESLPRFDALIESPDKFVDVETLGEITGWLVEEYTNRPNSQPKA